MQKHLSHRSVPSEANQHLNKKLEMELQASQQDPPEWCKAGSSHTNRRDVPVYDKPQMSAKEVAYTAPKMSGHGSRKTRFFVLEDVYGDDDTLELIEVLKSKLKNLPGLGGHQQGNQLKPNGPGKKNKSGQTPSGKGPLQTPDQSAVASPSQVPTPAHHGPPINMKGKTVAHNQNLAQTDRPSPRPITDGNRVQISPGTNLEELATSQSAPPNNLTTGPIAATTKDCGTIVDQAGKTSGIEIDTSDETATYQSGQPSVSAVALLIQLCSNNKDRPEVSAPST